MNELVKLAASVGEWPTLEQTDALLAELGRMPRDHTVSGLIDDLLDYRGLVATTSR
jgi:hypothetical protein